MASLGSVNARACSTQAPSIKKTSLLPVTARLVRPSKKGGVKRRLFVGTATPLRSSHNVVVRVCVTPVKALNNTARWRIGLSCQAPPKLCSTAVGAAAEIPRELLAPSSRMRTSLDGNACTLGRESVVPPCTTMRRRAVS